MFENFRVGDRVYFTGRTSYKHKVRAASGTVVSVSSRGVCARLDEGREPYTTRAIFEKDRGQYSVAARELVDRNFTDYGKFTQGLVYVVPKPQYGFANVADTVIPSIEGLCQ